MGDASLPKPNILLAFSRELPDLLYYELRKRFPDAEITSVTLEPGARIPSGKLPIHDLLANLTVAQKSLKRRASLPHITTSPTPKTPSSKHAHPCA
jgi:hypothetical protein